jgi:hypothetical protein
VLTDECQNRLYNWKFRQAASELTDQATVPEREAVEQLAESFGNPGWFVGHGPVGVGSLVGAMVRLLIGEEEEP